jgi:hypothetical protein
MRPEKLVYPGNLMTGSKIRLEMAKVISGLEIQAARNAGKSTAAAQFKLFLQDCIVKVNPLVI